LLTLVVAPKTFQLAKDCIVWWGVEGKWYKQCTYFG